jgi:hypothetical protein
MLPDRNATGIADPHRPAMGGPGCWKEDSVMKIHRSMLAAVVMMVGSLGAMGCKGNATQGAEAPATPAQAGTPVEAPAASAAPAPEPAPEPVKAAAIAPSTSTSPGILAGPSGAPFVRPAPPPLRLEFPGVAPTAHHVFRRGFWQWDAGRALYTWVPGFWEDTALAAPVAPPPPRFENPGVAPSPDYVFVRGFWRFEGHGYRWVPGHWEARRDADGCARPVYVKIDGRWRLRPDHDHRDGVTVSVGVRARS